VSNDASSAPAIVPVASRPATGQNATVADCPSMCWSATIAERDDGFSREGRLLRATPTHSDAPAPSRLLRRRARTQRMGQEG
jgi:hypothetical protein